MLLDDSNLGLGIGFLLAFLIDNGCGSTTDEAFVGELGFHALQEALGVFQLLLELLDLGLHIDAVGERHEELGAAHKEAEGSSGSFSHIADLTHVAELGDDTVEVLVGSALHNELDGFAVGDVLVGTNLADVVDDLLGELHLLEDLFIDFLGLGLLGDNNIITVLALGDSMPDLLGDERHEGMQHQHQVLKELDGGGVGHGVDALAQRSLHHLKVP